MYDMSRLKADATAANGKTANGGDLGFEATLWSTADPFRGSMNAPEYKQRVLGLIFLKYISDAKSRTPIPRMGRIRRGDMF
jgi:hypothetical protein